MSASGSRAAKRDERPVQWLNRLRALIGSSSHTHASAFNASEADLAEKAAGLIGIGVENSLLKLHWRDWPKLPLFARRLSQVALLPPANPR